MIAKLIVWGRDRAESLARLARAIDEYRIAGVPTTLPLLARARRLRTGPRRIVRHANPRTVRRIARKLVAGDGRRPRCSAGCRRRHDSGRGQRQTLSRAIRRLPAPGSQRRTASGSKGGCEPRARGDRPQGNDILAPMHGVVVELPLAEGAAVASGDVVAVIEAMKMMNEIRAHKAGTVAKIHVATGATVEARLPLITLA
jgi:acetyl-CoA/propionyl-CoA carboxylase biotin carboxyl carrier protein